MTIKNKTTDGGIIVPDSYVAERKNYSTTQIFELLQGGSANWFGDNTAKLIHEGFKNPIAAACMDKIATAVGQLELQVFDSRGNLVEENEITELLRRPNTEQSLNAFLKGLMLNKLAFGSAYIRAIVGQGGRDELHLLQPNNVTVEPGPRMRPLWFDHQPQYSAKERYHVDQSNGDCEVHRFFDKDLTDQFKSLSKLQQAAQDIAIHNQGAEWNKKLLQNGAKPSGILTVKNNISDAAREHVTRQFKTNHTGSGNAGGTIMIEGEDVNYHQLSLSPKDVDFLNGRIQAARDIATVFGVPSQLLNIPDSQTYNNNREAKLALYEMVVLPEAYEICNELNNWLMPMYGDYKLKINEDNVTALQIRRDEMWERLGGAEITTKNERREMLGLEPIDEEELPQPAAPAVEDEKQPEDDEDDSKSLDTRELKSLDVADGHTHSIDTDVKNGQTTETNGHSHSYTYSDGKISCGITDGHRHNLTTESN